jgi:hypothetical protein
MTDEIDAGRLTLGHQPHLTCPACGERELHVELALTARPLGTWSLSGAQPKTSAREVPVIRCAACGISSEGRVDR